MNNDRFKFRGKRQGYNNWIYGSLIVLPNNNFGIVQDNDISENDNGDAFDFSYAPVVAGTVGQCTGLSAVKSYRGVKPEDLLIFEGDVIEHKSIDGEWTEWIVQFNASYGRWQANNKNEIYDITVSLFSVSEIIGNIHESEGK